MILSPIKALGTVWHIELLEKRDDILDIQVATEGFLEEFEIRYSRFKADSWLSQLNTNRVFKRPDSEFVTLLKQAISFYEQTNGVFNIAIGEKMIASGYDSAYSFNVKGNEVEVPVLTDVLSVNSDVIKLNNGSLDLGGIGKGFAIDALAQMYKQKFNLQYFLINGGGDIYATSDNGQPITITLAHPTDNRLGIGIVKLLDQGFAASSPYVRAWPDRVTGKLHNHLHTVVNVASYVVATDACTADVWATSCSVQPEILIPSAISLLQIKDTQIIKSADVFKLNSPSAVI